MSHMTNLNQFALLYFTMKFERSNIEGLHIEQNVTVHIDRLTSTHLSPNWQTRFHMQQANIYNETVLFNITEEDIEEYLIEDHEDFEDDDDDDDNDYIYFQPILGFDRVLED